jgi:hypothetical protein
MKAKKIQDAVLIGEWKEVNGTDVENKGLDGIILSGMETAFGVTNANGERYTREALDKFVQDYFVANDLNIPLTLMHGERFEDVIGKVLSIDVTDKGFKVLAYIPKTAIRYKTVKAYLQEGILQGFSKEGWATGYESKPDEDGNEYLEISEIALTAVSLVTTPANALGFDSVKVTNATKFNKSYKMDEYKEFFI